MTTATAMVIPIENSDLEGMMKEIKGWWNRTDGSWVQLTSAQLTNRILGVLIAVAFTMAGVQIVRDSMTIDEAFNSLSTELFGAAVTFYALELVVRPKKRAENRETYKQQLIKDMGSSVRDVAIKAAEELRAEGWDMDGSLRRAALHGANLRSSILARSDLEGAYLVAANLQGAFLERANLQKASLWNAKLQGAFLAGANLSGANLTKANMEGSDLKHVNLCGVSQIDTAIFNKLTILPNGDKWHKRYDLNIFTDPDHPNFWEPE